MRLPEHSKLSLCLAFALLLGPALASGALKMADFTPPPNAGIPETPLSGRIHLAATTGMTLEVLRDDYNFSAHPELRLSELPAFHFDYRQVDGALVPGQRGLQISDHPHWDLLLEVGRVWVAEQGRVYFSLPFALQEKNANCTHNGVLGGNLNDDGELGSVRVLIASETCLYFKFNLEGELAGNFNRAPPGTDAELVQGYREHLAHRTPQQPLAELTSDNSPLDPAALAGPGANLSAWGLVQDGIHYRSDCPTRRGAYPFCDSLSLPSYSLAKSLVGGLGMMRLAHLYPGSEQRSIAATIPECAEAGSWDAVQLQHALNMTTGHFESAAAQVDESSVAMTEGFFIATDHAARIHFACGHWPRQQAPGQRFVYHTSDTYLLGVAMTSVLREHEGPAADLYDDLLLPLFQSLHLSPALGTTRRTPDDQRQPFTGYGLTLLRDDIVRLALALSGDEFTDQVDNEMLQAALQRRPDARGSYPAEAEGFYYQHGFWGYDATQLLGCAEPLVVPFLSGFGGINVLLLPDQRVYYYVSDGGQFAFTRALGAIHHLQPLCTAQASTDNQNKGLSR